MLAYPQLITGALTQFPLTKRRHLRTITNALADGSLIKLSDPEAEVTEWQLQYTDLSDSEAAALQAFFEATEGSLRVFTFLDPSANLFAWSDDLDHTEWTKGPLLSVSGGLPDPLGGNDAWHVINSGAGPQSVSQILEIPGACICCLSLYARSFVPGTVVTLFRNSSRVDRVLGGEWLRVLCSSSGNPAADRAEFGIELPAGGSLDIFGMQVEPQTAASGYKPSIWGGVYPNAWFADDHLALTATDVNRHSATVTIVHANRL